MREESKVEYMSYLQSSFPGHSIANDCISLPVIMAPFLGPFVILAKLFILIALSSCLSQFELVKPQVCFSQF